MEKILPRCKWGKKGSKAWLCMPSEIYKTAKSREKQTKSTLWSALKKVIGRETPIKARSWWWWFADTYKPSSQCLLAVKKANTTPRCVNRGLRYKSKTIIMSLFRGPKRPHQSNSTTLGTVQQEGRCSFRGTGDGDTKEKATETWWRHDGVHRWWWFQNKLEKN